MICALLLGHGSAAGQESTPVRVDASTETSINAEFYDSTSVGRRGGLDRPFWVMMRSAVFPGWGQMHNGSWWKALILGGAESAFLYGIFREDQLAEDYSEKAALASNSVDEDYYRSISSSHRAKKKDYVWWGAFVGLLSLGDAYVGAHLDRFDAEFRPEDSAVLLSLEVYP